MAQKTENAQGVQEIKIKIVEVKEVTTDDGHKFNTFKTVDKSGKLMDVRFTRACKTIPESPCTIVVSPDMANVAKNRQYPCVWVKDVIRIEETPYESNIGDYFD